MTALECVRADQPEEDASSAASDKEGSQNHAILQALDYIRRGLHVIPLGAGTKIPVTGWQWKEAKVSIESAADLFGKFQHNIGVALGQASNGLVDVDLDWPEARTIAEALGIFDALPAFGRAGAKRSHRVAICAEGQKKPGGGKRRIKNGGSGGGIRKFELPSTLKGDPRLPEDHELCVAELRGTGGYTMFPGSIHPNGELVSWAHGPPSDIPFRSWGELEEGLGLVSFLAVVLRFYPARGRRDEACMALAGTLLRRFHRAKPETAVEEVDRIIKTVAKLAGDEEFEKRGKAAGTWQKMQSGERVTGFSRLMTILGLPEKNSMRDWLGTEVEVDGLPVISLDHDLKRALDQTEAALKAAGVPIYQRAGKLVRTYRLDCEDTATEGVVRQSGSLTIDEVEPFWFSQQIQQLATFVSKGGPIEPSTTFCKHYIIGRKGEWKVPVLKGIIEAPTLRPDGTVLQEKGYDLRTRLFLDFGQAEFPKVPEDPTFEDAKQALESFVEVIRGFPFVPDQMPDDWYPDQNEGRKPSASRSVFLSAWLSGCVRRTLRTVPLHAIDAPTMGTGKSKIADIVSIILTGRPANVMSQGGSEEEDEKRLFATLWAGDPVISIDNIERPLEGSALCSILTQETWKGRILGKSQTVPVPTNALILATGNNLILRGDMTRRAVVCRLDARSERPDERQFDFDAITLAHEQREHLLVAGLTILRAYIVAGRPLKGKVPDVGSFEDWTRIREALIWLGQPDPAATRQQVLGNDPRQDELCEVMDLWGDCFGDRDLSIRELIKEIERAERSMTSEGCLVDLGKALRGITRSQALNSKSLGWWFRRNSTVVVKGRQFVLSGRGGAREKSYRLVHIKGGDGDETDPISFLGLES